MKVLSSGIYSELQKTFRTRNSSHKSARVFSNAIPQKNTRCCTWPLHVRSVKGWICEKSLVTCVTPLPVTIYFCENISWNVWIDAARSLSRCDFFRFFLNYKPFSNLHNKWCLLPHLKPALYIFKYATDVVWHVSQVMLLPNFSTTCLSADEQ